MRKRFLSLLLAALMVLTSALTLVPVTANETDTAAPEETTTLTLDDLYVKGATFMWDAFDMKSTDEVITAFENKVGDTNVTLPVAVTMGDGYVSYPYTTTGFKLNSLIPSHQVGTRYLPDDYTLEMTVAQYWDDTCTAGSNVKWAIAGFGTGSSWGGQFQIWTQAPTETAGSINKVTSMFATMNEDGSLKDHYNNSVTWTSIFANTLNKPYSLGWTHDATFSADATYFPSADIPHRDGLLNTSITRNHFLRNATYDNLKDKGFTIGAYTPFKYYSLRIYPFALNADEVAQNHFAELCDYFNIGKAALGTIASLDEDTLISLYNKFCGRTFDDFENTEALEAAITHTISAIRREKVMAMYDSLYVENPIYLWDAYSYTEGSADVPAFTSSVGDAILPLSGTPYDRYVRSTSALSFTPILPMTTTSGGATVNDDVTIEVVAKQIYDDDFASIMKAGQKYTDGTGYLVRRWADSRMEITTKTPTLDEATGTYTDGFINTVPLVYMNVTTGKQASWGAATWLSAKIGEVYSFGASFKFDAENEHPQFHLQLLRDGAVLKETDHQYTASNNKFGITDKANVICMGYYAIRAYNRVLNQDEMTQNHFADLVKYFDIGEDAWGELTALDAEQQKALYNSYANVTFDETTKNELIAAIGAAKSNITSAFLTDNEIFLFDGYSSRLYVDPAIRASFTVDTTKLTVDGVTVLEMGTLSAMKGERALANLTVAENEGTYAPVDADVAHNVIYQGGEFTGKIGEDGNLKAYQMVTFDAKTATKADYHVEYLFRGYAIVEAEGVRYVLYTDMTSARFGEEISMYELASDKNVAHHEINKDVVNEAIKNPEKKTFRMLAIGNSFSLNSTEYLYKIAKEQGYEDIVIGVMYIGGCSVKTHLSHALSGANSYDYYLKYDNSANGVKLTKANFNDGLLDEPWDYIVIHQASHLSGSVNTYMEGLEGLVDYVKANKTNYNAQLFWNITWAFGQDHGHYLKDDPNYAFLNDQDMQDHILSTMTKEQIIPLGYFDGIIPSGKAIRNAREYYGGGRVGSLYGSDADDGYHLNNKGKVIAALTWFAAITGEDISDNTVVADGSNNEVNIEAVQNALLDPFYFNE